MLDTFDRLLNTEERDLLARLSDPVRIQEFRDATPYSTGDFNRCPLRVLRERQAHCLDGALFAALALRRLGHRPLIVDLLPAPGSDDDHVLAIYRENNGLGALAKSNFAGLRSRAPVYRTLRELVLSYFEDYFNVDGLRSLRGYTRPLDLSVYDRWDWAGSDAGADAIEKRLYGLRGIPLLTPTMAATLSPVDALSYQSGTLGTNPAGLYRPHAAEEQRVRR